MKRFVKRSLHSKILALVVGLIAMGVIFSIFWEMRLRERELLDEKLRASSFIATPILNSIYSDMLEERADMARHLINTMSNTKGQEIKIVRSNGVEEAFMDFKTIENVKVEFGEVKPEWLTDHPDIQDNVAKGVETPEFKAAFAEFKADWKRGPSHYIDKSGPVPVFTYLQPIEKKSKCNSCHTAEGARGILMISTPLDEMYAMLSSHKNKWIVAGVLAIGIGGGLLSMLIRESVTGPISKTVDIIRRIEEGGGISERIKVDSEDEIGYMTSAFNNMLDTLEKRDEENRKLLDMVTKSKEEWVATFDAIHDLISIHDRDYKILKVNKALAGKLGVPPEDLVGRQYFDLLHCSGESRGACPHDKTIETGKMASVEVDDFLFDGTYEVTTFPIFNETNDIVATVHVARDITEEKLLREQLLHSEKLSSVGKLVAGIAHELNNPLMGIMGFSQILMDTAEDKPISEIKRKLEKIYNESLRTAKIVQNLLTFSRSKKAERKYLSLNELLQQTCDLRGYSFKANNIKVELKLTPGLPKTMLDPHQMQQVFINILNNAEDAITAKKGGGNIAISSYIKNDRLCASFTDDGPGVDKGVIRNVFDPFFTTKEVGKGTGLGLSITHGIVTEHKGSIHIKSPEGGGAVVTVELPIVGDTEWVEVEKLLDDVEEQLTGTEILVVDDEESIREALSDILESDGFTVTTACDGHEAMEELAKRRFSLLITDIRMPGISGADFYSTVIDKYPYMKKKVVVITGDIFNKTTKDFLKRSGCPYFLKPFEPKELKALIHRVLSVPRQGRG